MEDNSEPNWDEVVDIAIVGSGFAGLAAALEIAQTDSSFIILEKMDKPGGNSVIDAGELSVVDSPQQRKRHIKDSANLLAQDMIVNGEFQNSPKIVKYVADHAHDIYLWTTETLGVQWTSGLGQAGGHSVPRTITTRTGSGSEIYNAMRKKLAEIGVFPRLHSYVQNILRSTSGEIQGLIVREGYQFPEKSSGVERKIKINKALILCYGGFSADVAFRQKQDKNLTALYSTTNQPGATGELWEETARIGCFQLNTNWIQCTPWNNPLEEGLGIGWIFSEYATAPYGLWVNSNGNRFVNEVANRKIRCDAIFKEHQHNLKTFCLSNLAGTRALHEARPGYLDKVLSQGLVHQYEDLSTLEKAEGFPSGSLQKEIELFNKQIATRKIDQFGRNLRSLKPLVHGPWLIAEMKPKVHHCMGGLVADIAGRVLDAKTQKPIPHLYAAGECTSGVHGACRLGSCAILDCLVMGRTVGRNASFEPMA